MTATATRTPSAVIERKDKPIPHFAVTLPNRPVVNLYPTNDPDVWYADSRTKAGVSYRIENTADGWECKCPARIPNCAHYLSLMALFAWYPHLDAPAPANDWNDIAPKKGSPMNAPESPTALTVIDRSLATRNREEGLSAQLHDPSKQDILWNHLAPGLNPPERALFVEVCTNTGLNPFMKQIYAIPRGLGDRRKVTHQVSIDGFRLIAHRTGLHAGTDDAVFEEDANGKVKKATVTVWKLVGGQRFPFTASALFKEYASDADKSWSQWYIRPHTMTAKCAESLALRKAFPAEMSGLYTEDEMAQADTPVYRAPEVYFDGGTTSDEDEAEIVWHWMDAYDAARKDAGGMKHGPIAQFLGVAVSELWPAVDTYLTSKNATPKALVSSVADWLAAGKPKTPPPPVATTETFDEGDYVDPSAEPALFDMAPEPQRAAPGRHG